jgi:hypothetical protein
VLTLSLTLTLYQVTANPVLTLTLSLTLSLYQVIASEFDQTLTLTDGIVCVTRRTGTGGGT